MLKFQSKFSQLAKISCEWEIYSYIFESCENPKLQTSTSLVPEMPGLRWWLTAFPCGTEKFDNSLSLFFELATESDVHASISFRIKGTNHKRTVEHREFRSGASDWGWPYFISHDELIENYEKYFKDGKITIVFEAEFYRPDAFQTVQVKEE